MWKWNYQMHARNMRFYVYLSLILESVKKKDANRALTYQPARRMLIIFLMGYIQTRKLQWLAYITVHPCSVGIIDIIQKGDPLWRNFETCSYKNAFD